MPSPLAGIRILDLTSVIMGPYATQMLAEYGADVIKVEPPEGDIMRKMGPCGKAGMGPVFLNLNRGKRSLCLDLKSAAGRDAMYRAVASADVFITNVRLKALKKLGLDRDALHQHNPRLIYLFLSGFSEAGRHAGRPAYDDLIQAMVGLPHLSTAAAGGDPRYVPLNIADKTMGLFAAQTVLAALLQRARSGSGQYIELPMYETMAGFVLLDHLAGNTLVPPVGEPGNPRLVSRYRRPYRTRDGWLSTMIYTDGHWAAFLALVGRPDIWERDRRFGSVAARTECVDIVYAFIEEQMLQRDSADWLEALARADIPVAPIADLKALVDDLRQSPAGVIEEYQGHSGERYLGVSPAVRWAGASAPLAAAPSLGEHNEEILRELPAAHRESRPQSR
ncbi:CoA transferase [Cupriavidus basilensis]|uniref:CoA transferase n=1 Tax=Cupriavidus basilensis TaxID=68895 RepID=A0ABT6ANN3_9BURK|nr:CoA transferase [Cupriavidus basilensis]MDF3834213.1 CoA transferase [Cupriavidus basilensis]